MSRKIFAVGTLAAIVLSGGMAEAQTIVLNGLYDCQRATNGRAYCKRQGAPPSNQYVPVSNDFFASYEAARIGRPVLPATQVTQEQVTQTQVVNNGVIIQLKSEAGDIKGQIDLMRRVLAEQKKLSSGPQNDPDISQQTAEAISERLTELQASYEQKAKALAGYATPIRPDDGDLGITARKASEIYPKIPYYIPGTRETGEFWVEPVVSDNGALRFRFNFVDVSSSAAEKVRSMIDMSPEELERTRRALLKIGADSKLAHDRKIRRKLDARVECFPEADCPPEGQKIDMKASTEIIFSINEDGSTSGRIQRNKGRFEEGYNVSVKSGLLLQAYLNHVLTEGQAEYDAGTASTEDLKNIFR